MSFKNKVETGLNKFSKYLEKNPMAKPFMWTAAVLFSFAIVSLLTSKKNDISAGSVMITTVSGNSGGTGVILHSSPTESSVLTNSHVCRVIENGGLVTTRTGTYLISSYKHSQNHDICMVTVDADLHYNTKVANRPSVPYYEHASISGHPALLPNVITTGLFSGRRIIEVMTGLRKCTEEDMKNPNAAFFCFLAGGIPEVKRYDSVLVTATIMPGSSGSGVYNENMELAGLAFAGNGGIGYAWTVPYEDLHNFIYAEEKTISPQKPSISVDIFGANSENKKSFNEAEVMKKARAACESSNKDKIKDICNLIQDDLVYRK